MRRYLIYQYYSKSTKDTDRVVHVDYEYQELSKISVSAYVDKWQRELEDTDIEVEYKFINKPNPLSAYYGIFTPFTEQWCHDYHKMCFIDSDILITENAPFIFWQVCARSTSMNVMSTDRGELYKEHLPMLRHRGHLNSGVVCFTQHMYDDFCKYLQGLEEYHNNRDYMIRDLGDYDQAFLNLYLGNNGRYSPLEDRFNWHLGRQPHDKRWDAYFIHYHRNHKKLMRSDFNDDRIIK